MSYDNIHRSYRDKLIKEHRDVLDGTVFLEFGVCHGGSMLMWYDLYERNNLDRNFVGFDSFQGLPEETIDKNTIWHKGQFNTRGIINPDLKKEDIRLVQGFYDESLTDKLAATLDKVGLVHIDCDTYSSTKTVWEWLIKHDLLVEGS
jgi:hypothetical protein